MIESVMSQIRDIGYFDKLNTLRLSELCRDANDTVLEEILAKSTPMAYTAGEVIYREGEPADSFCIVHSGAIEIFNETTDGGSVVAYLGPTECVGELALLMQCARTATARVPESAEVLVIPSAVFEGLFLRFPVFLRQLCGILARRLERTTNLKCAPSSEAGLEGRLGVFDLSIVLQTLIDSRKSGRLMLEVTAAGEPVEAGIFFEAGRMLWAQLGRLRGAEAVYQLFQRPLEGSFRFVHEPCSAAPGRNVTDEPMSVLLEAMRLQDELGVLQQHLPDPSIVLGPAREQLQWTDYETAKFAAALWQAIRRRPESLETLLRAAPFSHERVYRVAWGLLQTGQIQIVGAVQADAMAQH
jgi:CRP-like cAMP-binding protein